MDPLEILPWGREEAELEREYLSEAWLSTPMLEEEYDYKPDATKESSAEDVADTDMLEGSTNTKSDVNYDSFMKWMEMNDIELAMYQQHFNRQNYPKSYVQTNNWDNSGAEDIDSTEALLQEFETVCDEYHGNLTPPRSRTPSPPPLISYIPAEQQPPIQLTASQAAYPVDIAQELAMLDELVRDRAEALENASPAFLQKKTEQRIEVMIPVSQTIPALSQVEASVPDISSMPSLIVPDSLPPVKVEIISPSMSPASFQEVPASLEASPSVSYCLSPTSVAPSSPGSPRPSTPPSSSSGEVSDPEWLPSKVIIKRQRSKPYSRSTRVSNSDYSSSDVSEFSPAPSVSQGRRAPRVRGQGKFEDRKERKKEQNKNAATRYRQKKKAEAEEVASEERQLEDKNDSLRAKAADLAREVSYLKKLMKEMFQARGML